MPHKKNIILVDDHNFVALGLKELIEKLGPYKITHILNNGKALLECLEAGSSADLIILDNSMPVMSGLEVMMHFYANKIKIPVLMLTENEDESLIVKLFRLGIKGFLSKKCRAHEMSEAINQIFESGFYVNTYLQNSLLEPQNSGAKTIQESIIAEMTPQERQFIKLVCNEEEYTYVLIAEKLKISERSVDRLREQVFEKYKLKSKVGIVLFVYRHGLLEYL